MNPEKIRAAHDKKLVGELVKNHYPRHLRQVSRREAEDFAASTADQTRAQRQGNVAANALKQVITKTSEKVDINGHLVGEPDEVSLNW